MKCYQCKAEVETGAPFCVKCGAYQMFTDYVNLALSGNQDAVSQLYIMTKDNVYYTVISMTADEDLTADIMQDAYVRAFRNLNQLREPEAFRGWVKQIAHNLTVDYFRRKKPMLFSETVPIDSEDVPDFEDERIDHIPAEMIDRQETARLIKEMLSSLSEDQRAVIGMYYYEQLSVREIAEILNVSENTVKSRLNYGRKNIGIKVKELERRGTKLYGLAPIPFLLMLFGTRETQAAMVPESVFSGIQQNLLYFSPAQMASGYPDANRIKNAGVSGAKAAAGKGVAVKLTAAILAVTLAGAGAGIYGGHVYKEKKAQEKASQVTVKDSAGNVDYEKIYADTLKLHREAAKNEDDSWDAAKLQDNNMSPVYSYYVKTNPVEQFGYACSQYHFWSSYYDINEDGVPELLFGEDDQNKEIVYEIYTVNKDEVKQVFCGDEDNYCLVMEDGIIERQVYKDGTLVNNFYNLKENGNLVTTKSDTDKEEVHLSTMILSDTMYAEGFYYIGEYDDMKCIELLGTDRVQDGVVATMRLYATVFYGEGGDPTPTSEIALKCENEKWISQDDSFSCTISLDENQKEIVFEGNGSTGGEDGAVFNGSYVYWENISVQEAVRVKRKYIKDSADIRYEISNTYPKNATVALKSHISFYDKNTGAGGGYFFIGTNEENRDYGYDFNNFYISPGYEKTTEEE